MLLYGLADFLAAMMAWALSALSGRILSRQTLWPTMAGLVLVLLALLAS